MDDSSFFSPYGDNSSSDSSQNSDPSAQAVDERPHSYSTSNWCGQSLQNSYYEGAYEPCPPRSETHVAPHVPKSLSVPSKRGSKPSPPGKHEQHGHSRHQETMSMGEQLHEPNALYRSCPQNMIPHQWSQAGLYEGFNHMATDSTLYKNVGSNGPLHHRQRSPASNITGQDHSSYGQTNNGEYRRPGQMPIYNQRTVRPTSTQVTPSSYRTPSNAPMWHTGVRPSLQGQTNGQAQQLFDIPAMRVYSPPSIGGGAPGNQLASRATSVASIPCMDYRPDLLRCPEKSLSRGRAGLMVPGAVIRRRRGTSVSSSAESEDSSSPNPIHCGFCGKPYSGEYRKGNLARHKRQKHGEAVQTYPCEAGGCSQQPFKRQDARLKHYRKHHRWLAPSDPQSRK